MPNIDLSELKVLADQIRDNEEPITQNVLDIEKQLNSIPVRVWGLVLDSSHVALKFGQILNTSGREEWGFSIIDFNNSTYKFIDAPIPLRFQAAALVPNLLNSLKTKMEAIVSSVQIIATQADVLSGKIDNPDKIDSGKIVPVDSVVNAEIK